jgi:hypothetical protein
MSACSDFKPGAWKKDQCRNCFQKEFVHPNSSISTTSGDQQEKLSPSTRNAPSPSQRKKQTFTDDSTATNTRRNSQEVQNNTVIKSDSIPSNIYENNSQVTNQQNMSISVISITLVNIILPCMEQTASGT